MAKDDQPAKPTTAATATTTAAPATKNPQLGPLEVNPETGEVFLRLRKHPNIILTPPRLSDVEALPKYMNDPRVYNVLEAPPLPYTTADAEDYHIGISKPFSEAIVKELEDAREEKELKVVGGAPTRYLREIKEDGTEELVGICDVGRYVRFELLGEGKVDWDLRATAEPANKSLPAGDPNIVWTFAYWLAESQAGKGVMTDAVETLLHEWMIPRMKARRVVCLTFDENPGSRRVLEKSGFKEIRSFGVYKQIRGRDRGAVVFEYVA